MKVILDEADWKSEIEALISDESHEKVGDNPVVYALKKNGQVSLLQDSELTFTYLVETVPTDALDGGVYAAAAAGKTVTITLKGTTTHTDITVTSAE